MWHEITLANREAILKVLDRFNTNLAQLADAIRQEDSQEIENTFSRAKAARDKLTL